MLFLTVLFLWICTVWCELEASRVLCWWPINRNRSSNKRRIAGVCCNNSVGTILAFLCVVQTCFWLIIYAKDSLILQGMFSVYLLTVQADIKFSINHITDNSVIFCLKSVYSFAFLLFPCSLGCVVLLDVFKMHSTEYYWLSILSLYYIFYAAF